MFSLERNMDILPKRQDFVFMKRLSGIIYKYGDPKRGSLSLRKRERFKFVPQAFFLGGIFGMLLIFSPLLLKEANYRLFSFKKERIVVADKEIKRGNFGKLIKKENIKILTPVDPQFSLVIPKIGLNTKIIPNISPTDDNQYQKALKVAVAHAAGTFFPGEKGRVFIFGHSTDYIWNVPRFNAVFYLLKEVKVGDEIDIFYIWDKNFRQHILLINLRFSLTSLLVQAI